MLMFFVPAVFFTTTTTKTDIRPGRTIMMILIIISHG
jgi:hypothetical protein